MALRSIGTNLEVCIDHMESDEFEFEVGQGACPSEALDRRHGQQASSPAPKLNIQNFENRTISIILTDGSFPFKKSQHYLINRFRMKCDVA